MGDRYWEIRTTGLNNNWPVFDWLSPWREEGLKLPVQEKLMIAWCEEHLGEQGSCWNWAVGLAYFEPVNTRWGQQMINEGDMPPTDIRPNDVIFVFYNEEDAIEFKLVWG